MIGRSAAPAPAASVSQTPVDGRPCADREHVEIDSGVPCFYLPGVR